MKSSGIRKLCGDLSGWFSGVGPSKWAYGAGLAYAIATVAFFLMPREVVKENSPASPVSYQIVPAATPTVVPQLNHVDLSPSTQSAADKQVF